MLTMHRSLDCKIALYRRDRGVPHFHIEGVNFRCTVAIASFEPIFGSAPPPILRKAVKWARLNQTALMRGWEDLNG